MCETNSEEQERTERKESKKEGQTQREACQKTALCTTVSVVGNCLSCACGLSPVPPHAFLQRTWCLQSPRVPVLYQRVRLGIRVVALFQVSSGVQQRLLGGAELGSLCLS